MSQIVLYADPIEVKEDKVKYIDITKEDWLDNLEEILNMTDRLYVARQDLPAIKDVLEEDGNKYAFHILDPPGIYVGEKRPYGLDIMRAVFVDIRENFLQELAPYDAKKPIYIQEGYDEIRNRISQRFPKRDLQSYGRKEIEASEEMKDRERFVGTSPQFQNFVIEELEKPMGVKFRPHQLKVAYAMVRSDPNIRGAVAAHEVGTGKTLMAILSAICTMVLRPDLKIQEIEIIVKPVILAQWQTEIKRFPVKFQSKISLYKEATLYNQLKAGSDPTPQKIDTALRTYCQNKFLVIDEAHELRTELPTVYKSGDASLFSPEKITEFLKSPKPKGKKALMYLACAHMAPKVLLLSGTVVVNKPSDVVNLFNMILPPDKPLSKKEIEKAFSEERDIYRVAGRLKKKIGGLVSVVEKDTSLYPSTVVENRWIDMTPQYLKAYRQIENAKKEDNDKRDKKLQASAFFSGIRQASNIIDSISPKVEECIRLIKKHTSVDDPLRRVLIYSPFRENGLATVEKNLKFIGIEFRQITGDETRDKKQMDSIKAWYNEDDLSKPKVLLISQAGAVGLDLKRTSAVILLQPNWGPALDEQIVGRAVRSGSHADVPLKDRVVYVYHLFLKKPYEIVQKSENTTFVGVDKKIQEKADAELAALIGRGEEPPIIKDTMPSADYHLFQLTQEKAQTGSEFMEVLRVLSI